MQFKTADLCDAHAADLQVLETHYRAFGGRIDISGPIETVKTFEDNSLVHAMLERPGQGKVLVIDGEGSKRCALVGGDLAQSAVANGWSGIIVNGCIRDVGEIDALPIGVRALATHPVKSAKNDYGESNVTVTFGGVTFTPGHFVYADADGVVISPTRLA